MLYAEQVIWKIIFILKVSYVEFKLHITKMYRHKFLDVISMG